MDTMQIIQIIIAVALMIVILLQNRGTGLSGVFGGTGNVYLSKRGLEKKLFVATIILSIIFFVVSLAAVIL
ncbi:MAG: preprotein translocase subunit SecG [Patescibacteria group bacterium]|nr:preprotein translocase subunit SecG [Patescibacteria group bacterium]